MNTWYQESKTKINDPNFNEWEEFLISLINEYNSHRQNHLVQDIVIRSLERKRN